MSAGTASSSEGLQKHMSRAQLARRQSRNTIRDTLTEKDAHSDTKDSIQGSAEAVGLKWGLAGTAVAAGGVYASAMKNTAFHRSTAVSTKAFVIAGTGLALGTLQMGRVMQSAWKEPDQYGLGADHITSRGEKQYIAGPLSAKQKLSNAVYDNPHEVVAAGALPVLAFLAWKAPGVSGDKMFTRRITSVSVFGGITTLCLLGAAQVFRDRMNQRGGRYEAQPSSTASKTNLARRKTSKRLVNAGNIIEK